MSKALVKTDFNFPGQKSVYHGKVRDVYNINDELLVMVVSDRISAFDVILPEGIPYKGQVLNQIAAKFLDATADIVPNWKIATPDPMVTVGIKCVPFEVEMVVRGYLTGHAWKVGKKSKDNGLVILLVEDQRTIRFITGYGLEGDLPDAICKRIQVKKMNPFFRNNNWDGGMVSGIQAVCARLDGSMYQITSFLFRE